MKEQKKQIVKFGFRKQGNKLIKKLRDIGKGLLLLVGEHWEKPFSISWMTLGKAF